MEALVRYWFDESLGCAWVTDGLCDNIFELPLRKPKRPIPEAPILGWGPLDFAVPGKVSFEGECPSPASIPIVSEVGVAAKLMAALFSCFLASPPIDRCSIRQPFLALLQQTA